MDWSYLTNPQILPFLIPIVAILIPIVAIVMGVIKKIVEILVRHRERMAMIERGMHPDNVPEPVETGEDVYRHG